MRRQYRSVGVASATVFVLAMTQPAHGQVVTLLAGRTVDIASSTPIANAQIELLDAGQHRVAATVTDSAGRFRFQRRESGVWHLRAQSIGYKTVLSPALDLPVGDTVEVVLTLAVDAVPLAPLEVIARSTPAHRDPGLAAFYRRVDRAIGGRFILREEIMTRNARYTSDLLITAGVNVIGDPSVPGGKTGLYMKRLGCAPTVYIDGAKVTVRSKADTSSPAEAMELVNILRPFDIEGIEVYPGPASTPAEFGGSSAGCGVVAIWSRRG
jgi:Carboxypeptidase regulatory-like domain